MKKKDIFWTPLALESLQETERFVIYKYGEKVKEHFLDLIDNRLDEIAKYPNIAPQIKNTDFRRLIIHKHISLFYVYLGSYIKILLVRGNQQDPKELLKLLSTSKGI